VRLSVAEMTTNYFGSAFQEDRVARATVIEAPRPLDIQYVNGGQVIERPVEYFKYVDRPLKVEYDGMTVAKVDESANGFAHDVYELVLKPVGTGIAAPLVGVAALAGGIVWGALSLTKGVLGTIPIAIDYVVKPMNGALVAGVGKLDDGMRWALETPEDKPAVKLPSANYQYSQTPASLQPRIVDYDQVNRGPVWESPNFQDQYRTPVGSAGSMPPPLSTFRAAGSNVGSMSFPVAAGGSATYLAPPTQSQLMRAAVLSTPVSRVATPIPSFVAPTGRIQSTSEAYFSPSVDQAAQPMLKMRR